MWGSFNVQPLVFPVSAGNGHGSNRGDWSDYILAAASVMRAQSSHKRRETLREMMSDAPSGCWRNPSAAPNKCRSSLINAWAASIQADVHTLQKHFTYLRYLSGYMHYIYITGALGCIHPPLPSLPEAAGKEGMETIYAAACCCYMTVLHIVNGEVIHTLSSGCTSLTAAVTKGWFWMASRDVRKPRDSFFFF